MTKLRECGICKHEYLPIAHCEHCPICGCAPLLVGKKLFHIDMNNNRQIGRPFSVTRSLATAIRQIVDSL